MQNIIGNRKELNNMLRSSISLMRGYVNLVNLSKCNCIQHTVSDYEIMRNEVYTSAFANDISAIVDSASAIENDTLAIKIQFPQLQIIFLQLQMTLLQLKTTILQST